MLTHSGDRNAELDTKASKYEIGQFSRSAETLSRRAGLPLHSAPVLVPAMPNSLFGDCSTTTLGTPAKIIDCRTPSVVKSM